MTWIRRVVVALAIVVTGVVLMRNAVAKSVLSTGIHVITGLPADVKSVNVDLFRQAVGVRDLEIFQPDGFPDGVMVSVPEIYIDYRLGEFLSGTAHIEQMRLHVAELHVVKAENGRLNLRSIKAIESGTAQRGQAPSQEAPEFQIDSLKLQVGTVVYTDHTVSPPAVREFPVNIDQEFTGITNPHVFAGLIVSQALMKTTVASLANFDVAGLQRDVTTALRASAGALSGTLSEGLGAARKAGQTAASADAFTAAQQVGQSTTEAAKNVVGEATGTLKKVFGN